MDDAENERPVPRSRLSKTPSWLMLGFIFGALFVWSLPHEKPRSRVAGADVPPVRLERPKLTEIEAVFADWGQRAVWQNDVTEVALWDTEKRSFSIFYEVIRNGESYYFRSIPKLTRPLLTHGVKPNSPLQLTETEESRREWLQHGQFESATPAPDDGPPASQR